MSIAGRARQLAYSAVDAATLGRGIRRVIDGEELRLDPRWARFYPSTYDAPKRAFLQAHCRPGSTVVDVGAHLGVYSVVMARAVGEFGHVFAFEPTPSTVPALRRTLALNGVAAQVDVLSKAVGASTGTATLYDTGDALSNANSLVRGPRTELEVQVALTTVDDVVDGRRISCIKIDVEGGELEVLRGAARTIDRDHPAIALEVHPSVIGTAGLEELWSLVIDSGYRLEIAGVPIDHARFIQARDGFEVELVARGS